MARGDEFKITSKANYACKSFGITTPMKNLDNKSAQASAAKKPEPKKDNGAWGPIFKDKKTFTDMHFC